MGMLKIAVISLVGLASVGMAIEAMTSPEQRASDAAQKIANEAAQAVKEHIDAFIEAYNKDAEPFVWTKSKVHQRRVKGRRLRDL